MSTRKTLLQIIGLAFTIWLLAGCVSTPTEPTTMPTPVPPPITAATVSAKSGSITGRVHLVSPPTPRMVVYAVDQTTGLWAFTETAATDSEASFSLVVPPGSYQVFAFSDIDGYAGYTLDERTLAIVSVAANQTVSDIIVRPPSQSECGSMFGVPASPDGRFAAIAGPSADCLAAILNPAADSTPPQTNPEAIRIQFQPNSTMWDTPGDLAPNATLRFVLSAQKGQQMTVDLTTEPASSASLYAAVYIWAADGTVYTPNPTTNWTGVLPASQDYYIEVRSMSQQGINYTLSVTIPPQTPPEASRIQFQPNTTSWYTPGDLAPNTSIRFVLSALKGQQMTVDLTTEPASSATSTYASLYIWAADGRVYTPNPTTSWTGVLPASQDYYIEVRSMSQQSILYTLRVAIPAAGSTSPAGGGYGPVSLEVCQILQELATQAVSLTFSLEANAPFTDPLSGETGQGCTLTAMTTGLFFSDPSSVTGTLVNGMLGWTEQTAYQASGPTGE
ncbi:MAG: hypothetical protein MUO64_11380, partial [Anaerolineales bacterium]|nr:hypothetical protein [Anaerolineales bacterium]